MQEGANYLLAVQIWPAVSFLGLGRNTLSHIWQNAAARQTPNTSSAEKARERASGGWAKDFGPLPVGLSLFHSFKRQLMQKKRCATRRCCGALSSHGSRQQAADSRIIFRRILISAERCYIILMRARRIFTDVQFNEHLARNQAAHTFTRLNFR